VGQKQVLALDKVLCVKIKSKSEAGLQDNSAISRPHKILENDKKRIVKKSEYWIYLAVLNKIARNLRKWVVIYVFTRITEMDPLQRQTMATYSSMG